MTKTLPTPPLAPQLVLRVIMLLPVCLMLSGCAITIIPPIGLREPVPVFIADYGFHASLLLPRANGLIAEYAYGEWSWFVLNRNEWPDAVVALLWPTPGALGRRDINGPPRPELIVRQLGVTDVYEIRVEQPKVAQLLARLDARYRAADEVGVENPMIGLTFVHDPDAYCVINQCNSRLAEWLRELGCRVQETTCFADFAVESREATRSTMRE